MTYFSIILVFRYYGIIQAGYRQVLKTLQRDDSPDTSEVPFSSQSTAAVLPSTPHPKDASYRTFDKGVAVTPALSVGNVGRTDSTPFIENKFTVVPRNFQPPRSPSAKRPFTRDAGGGSFNSTISELSLDSTGSGRVAATKEEVASTSPERVGFSSRYPHAFTHTPDEQKTSAVEDNSDSTRPKAPTPMYIPSTPPVAKAQAEGAMSAGAPSRLGVVPVPESPSRGREKRATARKRDAESPEDTTTGFGRKRSRRTGT